MMIRLVTPPGSTFAYLALVASLVLPAVAHSQTPANPVSRSPNALIVLLASTPDAPEPEALAQRISQRREQDSRWLAGNPTSARVALPFRAESKTLRRLTSDSESPRARLERYVVLEYPAGRDLSGVIKTLAAHPHILHVERDLEFGLSMQVAGVFDPLNPLLDEQWGHDALNLLKAWDREKGHAFVGLIEIGLVADHEDLHPFAGYNIDQNQCSYVGEVFEGGNLRLQLSRNLSANATVACDVSGGTHGTHVAGIVAATPNNSKGVAGACWHCSLMITKVSELNSTTPGPIFSRSAAALTFLVDHGAQIVSMSWGLENYVCTGATGDLGMFCQALAYAELRDVSLIAAPGNDKRPVEFPASDTRVISVGGITSTGAFWERTACPCTLPNPPNICSQVPTWECGSNFTPGTQPTMSNQDLVAPAEAVLSSVLEGSSAGTLGCGDSNHPELGYGFCTGTSMSSPYVAGVAGLLRSINPALDKYEIRDALITNADRANAWHPQFGYGVPDAASSADAVLGKAAGNPLANRLTPLFSLYSTAAETHLYTTVPQMATAALFDPEVDYSTYVTPLVLPPPTPDYGAFPGAPCTVGPCDYEPRASVYLLTSDRAPFAGAPPLVPLYRMSFDAEWNGNPLNRSFFYTTETAGVERGRELGYDLVGIEGYLYSRCTPEPACIPRGAVRLFRLYHPGLDDYAVFPESEESTFRAAGYVSQPTQNDWIGYVYANQDTDLDDVVNGFENLAGTNPLVGDSDCDGLSDSAELLVYDSNGYGDPLAGTCTAMNVHISDSFGGGGALHGRTAEVGGVAWTARPSARVNSGRVIDGLALGGMPFVPSNLQGSPTVAVSADVDPSVSAWVGVGFASQATTAYWSAGQLWALLRPEGTYAIHANGTAIVLASGTIPGTATNGFHHVEIRYHTSSNTATVLLNGVTVVAAKALGFTPNIQYSGFHMHNAAEGGGKLDNFKIEKITSETLVLISDTFTGSGSLNGRPAELGAVTWVAKHGAVLASGRVTDGAAIGGVPFVPADFDGNPTSAVSAAVDPTSSGWVGVGFANQATTAFWSAGQLWVLLRPDGQYAVHGNGAASTLASGSIPGTPTDGFHQVEVRYHTAANAATVRINGVTVVAAQALTFNPAIQFAGFHMYQAAEGATRLDNFQVLSTAAP
jgi:serine protease